MLIFFINHLFIENIDDCHEMWYNTAVEAFRQRMCRCRDPKSNIGDKSIGAYGCRIAVCAF